ncbi:hypothetical protein [Cytobacillus dafuensis]|uniref:Uncharacterized protein n=1 Tax=Cytobacillus dafuensis TaxID=1742359 RepID=A0A5B8Z551_CYTDA|nr:hypothetical protein [Cytobacillus dafuensis]QED48007.1 hypothetical protein FSZ17_12550 [Cytobacillus dafuensis]
MNKKFSNLLLISIILIYGVNNETVFANSVKEEKPPKSVCIEEFEKEYQEFNNKVLKDIVKSFNLDLSEYQEFISDDLMLKVGEKLNDHSDKMSLQSLFVGSSNGSRRLFLKSGLEGKEGYFLYKKIDGNNVKKKLSKIGEVWVVMSVDEKKAKKIRIKRFNWDKCSEN